MALGNTAQSDLLKILIQNVAWANLGDAAGVQPSAAAGSIFIALHTASPGAAGTQTTSEAAYTNYARVAVARSAAGWTVSGTSPTQVANVAATTFPQSTSGPETESHFSAGRATSGAGEILWFGALNANLVVNNLITPSFAIGTLVLNIT